MKFVIRYHHADKHIIFYRKSAVVVFEIKYQVILVITITPYRKFLDGISYLPSPITVAKKKKGSPAASLHAPRGKAPELIRLALNLSIISKEHTHKENSLHMGSIHL